MLNYTAMEDEDLDDAKQAELEEWEQGEGNRDPAQQWRDARCACFGAVEKVGEEDVWKGHICTSDLRKYRSPLVRALLQKGHAFKIEKGEETLLEELCLGLDGYINYKTKHEGDPADYEAWKQAILRRVTEKLSRGDNTLYPQGGMGRQEIADLQQHLVFLKEDRAPHVVVGMCKYRYMYERSKYLHQGQTFALDPEGEDNILQRHWRFHEERALEMNNRLPYIYGIWKSAKKSLRWISGVRKEKGEAKGESQVGKKPGGSIAGAGKELVGLLTQLMHSLKRKDEDGRRKGQSKRCWFIESVEEVAQPLRFDATEVAKHRKTAGTVEFVTNHVSVL